MASWQWEHESNKRKTLKCHSTSPLIKECIIYLNSDHHFFWFFHVYRNTKNAASGGVEKDGNNKGMSESRRSIRNNFKKEEKKYWEKKEKEIYVKVWEILGKERRQVMKIMKRRTMYLLGGFVKWEMKATCGV